MGSNQDAIELVAAEDVDQLCQQDGAAGERQGAVAYLLKELVGRAAPQLRGDQDIGIKDRSHAACALHVRL